MKIERENMEKGITTENLIKCLSFIKDAYKNLAENNCNTGKVIGKGVDFPVKLETNKELYEYHAYVIEAAISAVMEVQQYREEEDGLIKRNDTFLELSDLFELIRQNPDLPIVPMVNYEIIADDYAAYWMARWGEARIDSYLLRDDWVWYLSDGKEEIFENLCELPEDLSKEQEEKYIEDTISSLPWTKAIIVKIEPL